jgi:ABC-type polysaccharide/polyol phosphate transport system ATPase subunit
MSDVAVSVRDLSKRFKLYRNPWHRVLEWLALGTTIRHETFWALQGISFEVRRGECLGIVGVNGAGKTTLLKILSRALYQTTGDFIVNGRLVSLLELGTGFHPELTGRQNILQGARLLGFPEEDVRRRMPAILDFAEIGEYIDQPVKRYSSGMFVRLAFSLFAHLEPDIYIVDEALSVGDVFFQQKCFDAFRELRRAGCTILFVSHDMEAVTHLCDRAILLSGGKIVSEGDPRSVVHDYFALMGQSAERGRLSARSSVRTAADGELSQIPQDVKHQLQQGVVATHAQVGTRAVEIVGWSVANPDGRVVSSVACGAVLVFWCLVRAHHACNDLNVGIHLYDRRGILVFAVSTANRGVKLPALQPGEQIVSATSVTFNLQPGGYTVLPQIASWSGAGDLGIIHDRIESLPPIVVIPTADAALAPFYGLVDLRTEIVWGRTER